MVWRICIHRVQDAELLFSGLRFHIVFMRICIDAHSTVWPQTSALTWHFNTIVSFFSVICRSISGDRFRGQFMQTQAALDKLLRGTSSLQNIASSQTQFLNIIVKIVIAELSVWSSCRLGSQWQLIWDLGDIWCAQHWHICQNKTASYFLWAQPFGNKQCESLRID